MTDKPKPEVEAPDTAEVATDAKQESEASAKPKISDPITLEEPIQRGETKITSLQVRKPKSGELRGMKLQTLLVSDVSSMLTLFPRITVPPITQAEADNLDPVDLVELAGTVTGFFMSQAERNQLMKMATEPQSMT